MISRRKLVIALLVVVGVLINLFINRHYISEEINRVEQDESYPISGECPGLTYNRSMLRMDAWSQVDSARHLFVFSAYYEMSSGVTIIGAKDSANVTYVCQLWYRKAKGHVIKVDISKISVLTHGESHGRRYAALNLNCPLPTVNAVPYAVSVAPYNEPCQQPNRLIPTREIIQTTQFKRNFTVCLKPFNFKYGRAYEFVEWMELTKILGADYFVLYNYSTASNTKQLTDYYSKRGEAEVVQWAVPMNVDQRRQKNGNKKSQKSTISLLLPR